jgi:outer membrane murein-binding lipoprotein Lpp
MINKKFETVPAIILISIVLAGCSNNAQPEIAKSDANQATTVLNNKNQSVAVLNNNIAAVNTPNASTPIAVNTPASTVDNNRKSLPPSAKAPTPQIGSGGGDMFLFTQVRSALSSDKELFNAVIVEIKEGTATLTGSVSSEAQKSKATQLIQGVQGIKSVKNNLRVSS